ncbi:MAG TPA: Uma2 family endonuclease [Gemmatimonadaceae bacterium]|nr:Uma2 family endonuclease [Gemmatimonadaceae bacterium]
MAAPLDFHTADMVRALNDAEPLHWPRYETVHGELLVSPAARMAHQIVVQRLLVRLSMYLSQEPVGEALSSPADISWGETDILVQPDVFVVPREQLRTWEWSDVRHLLLAVEVLSPSSIRADRFTKRRLYQERSVPLYWVVDIAERAVDVWTPDAREARVEREELVWKPDGAAAELRMELAEVFEGMPR